MLAAPQGQGIPKIAGPYNFGQTLVCGTGSWASNLPGASFYQAPQTYAYQWLRNGLAIAGAQSASYLPTTEGSYSCNVTASNAAGSAIQISLPAVVKAKPPVATISAPTTGGVYALGAHVGTAFSCTEGPGGPGLASCTDSNGAAAPNGSLSTSTAGSHTYTVTAISKDGQRVSTHISYTVSAPKPTAAPKRPVIASCLLWCADTQGTVALGMPSACRSAPAAAVRLRVDGSRSLCEQCRACEPDAPVGSEVALV